MEIRKCLLLICVALSYLCSTSQSSAQSQASIVYQNALKSTVTIITNLGQGSGFFIDSNSIVTNLHVIQGASEITFKSPISTGIFKIDSFYGIDTLNDLIILKTEGFTGVPLNYTAKQEEIGTDVFVIGSPKGLDASISQGIISGNREFNGIHLIQITAPISPGSSGGPVLNANSELIGVAVSQLKEGQNLNFCIPFTKVQICQAQSTTTTAILGHALLANEHLSDPTYQMVISIMEAMKNGTINILPVAPYLSPLLIEKNKKVITYTFNHFQIGGYLIEPMQNKGELTVLVWGRNNAWVHRLYFQSSTYENAHYLSIGTISRKIKFIDPWYKMDKFLPIGLIPKDQ